ncbi:hypothetical protein EL22_07525 [Halostagnicola sp. A56]|nr:hypothetical protein EL22_07525 [Halostagnicola sp. A56]
MVVSLSRFRRMIRFAGTVAHLDSDRVGGRGQPRGKRPAAERQITDYHAETNTTTTSKRIRRI